MTENLAIPTDSTFQQLSRLHEIISHVKPALLPILDGLVWHPLTDPQRETLSQVLLDEFLATGLGQDNEPNDRGLVLEDLLTFVNTNL